MVNKTVKYISKRNRRISKDIPITTINACYQQDLTRNKLFVNTNKGKVPYTQPFQTFSRGPLNEIAVMDRHRKKPQTCRKCCDDMTLLSKDLTQLKLSFGLFHLKSCSMKRKDLIHQDCLSHTELSFEIIKIMHMVSPRKTFTNW